MPRHPQLALPQLWCLLAGRKASLGQRALVGLPAKEGPSRLRVGALTSSTWRSTAAQPSPSATHMSVSHAMTSQVHGGLRQRTRRVWERPHLLTRYLCCLWRLCHPRGTAQAARRCCRQGGRVEEGQVRRWAPRSGIETTVRGGRTGTSRRWSLDIFRSGRAHCSFLENMDATRRTPRGRTWVLSLSRFASPEEVLWEGPCWKPSYRWW